LVSSVFGSLGAAPRSRTTSGSERTRTTWGRDTRTSRLALTMLFCSLRACCVFLFALRLLCFLFALGAYCAFRSRLALTVLAARTARLLCFLLVPRAHCAFRFVLRAHCFPVRPALTLVPPVRSPPGVRS